MMARRKNLPVQSRLSAFKHKATMPKPDLPFLNLQVLVPLWLAQRCQETRVWK